MPLFKAAAIGATLVDQGLCLSSSAFPRDQGRVRQVMTYKDALTDSMSWLAQQPDTIFIGQTVRFGGSYMGTTFSGVQQNKLVELPVMEESQMGMSLGLALEGYCVVSVFPRFDFVLLAMNQLVNHIDKIGWMSEGRMQPRIIIRTSVGPTEPLDAGPQHTGRYTDAMRLMLTTVVVIELQQPDLVIDVYRNAYAKGGIWLIVEEGELY